MRSAPTSSPEPVPPGAVLAEEPVTIVVVHHQRLRALTATVESFLAQTVPTRVIVVDNESPPGRSATLARDLGVEVVASGANLGFGAAANVGLRRWLRRGSGRFVAVAPHDARPAPDTIESLVRSLLLRPHAGLVGADVGDGGRPVIDHVLGAISGEPTVSAGFERCDYPHGTLLVADRACLEDIGLFDERYFAYCEEADLGLRATDRGWEVGMVRGALVSNPDMSSTVEQVAYLQHRNILLLLADHYGSWSVAVRITLGLGQLLVGSVRVPSRGLHWSPRGRLRGMVDHLRGHYGAPPAIGPLPPRGTSRIDQPMRPSSAATSSGLILTR